MRAVSGDLQCGPGCGTEARSGRIHELDAEFLSIRGMASGYFVDPFYQETVHYLTTAEHAVHLVHDHGQLPSVVAGHLHVKESQVTKWLAIWRAGASSTWSRLAVDPFSNGVLGLCEALIPGRTAFDKAVSVMRAGQQMSAALRPGIQQFQDNRPGWAKALFAQPDLVSRLNEDAIVGAGYLAAGRPRRPLQVEEVAEPDFLQWQRLGAAASGDGLVQFPDGQRLPLNNFSVGEPPAIHLLTVGEETRQNAARGLRDWCLRTRTAPLIYVTDGHPSNRTLFLRIMLALVGCQPYSAQLTPEVSAERSNGRYRAHFGDESRCSIETFPDRLVEALFATNSEGGVSRSAGLARRLSHLQVRLLTYDDYRLVRVEEGAVHPFGKCLRVDQPEGKRLLLATRRMNDTQRLDVIDFSLDLHRTEDGGWRLGKGLTDAEWIARSVLNKRGRLENLGPLLFDEEPCGPPELPSLEYEDQRRQVREQVERFLRRPILSGRPRNRPAQAAGVVTARPTGTGSEPAGASRTAAADSSSSEPEPIKSGVQTRFEAFHSLGEEPETRPVRRRRRPLLTQPDGTTALIITPRQKGLAPELAAEAAERERELENFPFAEDAYHFDQEWLARLPRAVGLLKAKVRAAWINPTVAVDLTMPVRHGAAIFWLPAAGRPRPPEINEMARDLVRALLDLDLQSTTRPLHQVLVDIDDCLELAGEVVGTSDDATWSAVHAALQEARGYAQADNRARMRGWLGQAVSAIGGRRRHA